jgi:hypothetical protein
MSPTFRHGRGTALLFDDEEVTPYFRETTMTRSVDLAETSAYGTFDKTYVVGMREGRLSVAGMFSGGVDEIDEQLSTLLGQEAAVPLTFGPEGLAVGRRTYHMSCEETNHEVNSPYNDIVATSAEFQSSGGIFGGHSYHALTAETAGGNSTSVDNGASSAFGLSAVLHVPTNTRNGALVGKIQHSTDDAVWVDLITFTSVPSSTTTAEILSVAGTVNRYLRGLWTVAGSTGSVTFHLSAARKNI